MILKDSWGDPINPKELPQQPIHNHPKASYRYLNCNFNNLKNIYAQYMCMVFTLLRLKCKVTHLKRS